ncbi:ATP-binding cassette domain-containing protein [Entomoplasma ellychniae]|nr:ABC transporter ATP-binding protein [Entomoplasma ellychniae]
MAIHLLCYAILIVCEQKIIDISQDKNYQQLVIFCGILIITMLFARVFNLITNLVSNKIKMLYKNYLRQQIAKKIIWEYAQDKNFIPSVSWLSADVEQIENSYLNEILEFIYNFTWVIIGVGFLAAYSWILFLATIIITIIIFIVSSLFQKMINKSTIAISEQNKVFLSKITDLINGFSLFWQNLMLFKFIRKNNEESELIENKIKKNSFNQVLQSEAIYSVSTISSVMILIFCGWLLYKGNITAGSVIAITQFSATFTYDSQATFRGLFHLIAGKKIANKFKLEQQYITNKPLKLSFQKLQLKNFALTIEGIELLKNLRFEIKNNQKILIIGHSGCGKTTFLKSLVKINQNYDGDILLNNKNYHSLSDETLYNSIYYSEQFPHLFEDTILNNITLWNEEVNELKIKNILDKLNFHPEYNLQSQIINLSGGEKQKILLAQAINTNRDILIFDEPTSSLDVRNTGTILEYLLSIDKTVIIVSHKLDDKLINEFDQIIDFNHLKI